MKIITKGIGMGKTYDLIMILAKNPQAGVMVAWQYRKDQVLNDLIFMMSEGTVPSDQYRSIKQRIFTRFEHLTGTSLTHIYIDNLCEFVQSLTPKILS